MSYKNSFKLLTTNFELVWKQLLYSIIILAFTSGLAYGIALPTINLLKNEGLFKEIASIFERIYTAPKEVAKSISLATDHFLDTISNNFSSIWASVIGSLFVSIFVFKLLKNMSAYNISSLMHLKMKSFVSVGYTSNFISNLRPSFRYALAKCIYELIFLALKLLTIITYINVANSAFGIIFGLFLTSLILILIYSTELTLFIGFASHMLENHGLCSAFKAFFVGNKIVLKRFFRNFSSTILVVLTIIFINLFLGIFTIGSGLLITLPASLVFISIFQLVAYFTSKGDRYYLSQSVLAIPINTENQKFN